MPLRKRHSTYLYVPSQPSESTLAACAVDFERIATDGLYRDAADGEVAVAYLIDHHHGLLCGLRHMHRKGLMNGDVKTGNSVIGCDGNLKMVDIGSSKRIDPLTGNGPFGKMGTPPLLPPEMFDDGKVVDGPTGVKTDIFTAALAGYELHEQRSLQTYIRCGASSNVVTCGAGHSVV